MPHILIALVSGFAVFLAATAALADDPEGRITVVGTGRVAASPDMATVEVGVSVFNAVASVALRQNSAVMQTLFAELEQAAIAVRDIQTAEISLQPQWGQRRSGNDQPKVVGYTASNLVRVRVRDLASLGTVLDRLGQAGANQIHGIRFGFQDPKPMMDEARRAAVADAAAKAALYASAAGVSLGAVLEISEPGGRITQPSFSRMASMEAADVPVAGGELSLTAQVTLVYALVP